MFQEWETSYPTKTPVHLFYRDPVECIQAIVGNPLFKDSIQFTPFKLFETAAKLTRVYTEWLSGDAAWTNQVSFFFSSATNLFDTRMKAELPDGATLLGTVLSSDKTKLTTMTGGREAHPLYISLANIDLDFQMKSTNHAFLLLALLPIPKFLHRNSRINGMLESRLIHECLDYILKPLKKAAEVGVMLTDPLGLQRFCYTPLAAFIVDTPESALLAGVAGKTSLVTTASYKEFGDAFRHPPRTADFTLSQLREIESTTNPLDLQLYFRRAQGFRLNGVHRPFWRDWPASDPSKFLTPDVLHHWHKMFWDHDVNWCLNVVGKLEVDFRFSILHPHTSFRHFKEGISKLKQVTGKEHRDIQRYLIPVVAGAVPKNFLRAIRALADFRYYGQACRINKDICRRIEESKNEFHQYKQAILDAGGRQGKNGPINNWHIPKLEFMQSVVPNIHLNGVTMQWSADVTERAHIHEIKISACLTNNQNYEAQICRYLDRREKCRNFDLATSMVEAGVDVCGSELHDREHPPSGMQVITDTSTLLEKIDPVSRLVGTKRVLVDFFADPDSNASSSLLQPLQTFRCP